MGNVGYKQRAARWSPGDTIFLPEKPRLLDEVALYAETGVSLFLKAAARLSENHDRDSLVYSVHHRFISYEMAPRHLHLMAEYIFDVCYENSRTAYVKVHKARIKSFSEAGSARADDLFGINVFRAAFHTPHRLPFTWGKSTTKRYDISIRGTTLHEGRRLIALQLEPRKPGEESPATIYLDEASLAVARIIESRISEEGATGERIIAFRLFEGKWLLDYVIQRGAGSDFYQRWQPGSRSAIESIYVYQPMSGQVKDGTFIHHMGLMSIPQPDYQVEWDSGGWETMDRIPLPAWVAELIKD